MSIMSSVINPAENVQSTLRVMALILKTIVHFTEPRSKMLTESESLVEVKSNTFLTRTREG